jgi:hypothetical protein
MNFAMQILNHLIINFYIIKYINNIRYTLIIIGKIILGMSMIFE